MTDKEKEALENFKKVSAIFAKKTESPQPDGVIIIKKNEATT